MNIYIYIYTGYLRLQQRQEQVSRVFGGDLPATTSRRLGILLSAFGAFWIGEGLGYPWPGEDLALIGLIVGFGLASAAGVALARRARVAEAAA